MTSTSFPTYLRELRNSLGLSLSEFGTRLSIAKTLVYDLENGLRKPSSDLLDILSERFDLDRLEVYLLADLIPKEILSTLQTDRVFADFTYQFSNGTLDPRLRTAFSDLLEQSDLYPS